MLEKLNEVKLNRAGVGSREQSRSRDQQPFLMTPIESYTVNTLCYCIEYANKLHDIERSLIGDLSYDGPVNALINIKKEVDIILSNTGQSSSSAAHPVLQSLTMMQSDTRKINAVVTDTHDAMSELVSVLNDLERTVLSPLLASRLSGIMDAMLKCEIPIDALSTDEAAFTSAQSMDEALDICTSSIDALLNDAKMLLVPDAVCVITRCCAQALASELERVTRNKPYSAFGGLLFDRRVRALGLYFNSMDVIGVRESLSRLSQIAMVMTVDKVLRCCDVVIMFSWTNWRIC